MSRDLHARLAEAYVTQSVATLGYADRFADRFAEAAAPDYALRVSRVGGGIVCGPAEPRGEVQVHVIPHGGTEVPVDFLSGAWSDRALAGLARLILLNSDAGTPSIATRLLDRARAGGGEVTTYVAYFGISRLFLDANRLLADDQVPATPYVGLAEPYREYLAEHGERLRTGLLLPWLRAVNALIRRHKATIVYHHHTYDVVGQAAKPYDRRAFRERPPAQVFWRRPSLGDGVDPVGYAPRAVMEAIADVMTRALWSRDGDPAPVRLDDPLSTPPMPYHGCVAEHGDERPWHLVYEVRKDLMTPRPRLDAWLGAVAQIAATATGLRRLSDTRVSATA